jgi:hypothetical protein
VVEIGVDAILLLVESRIGFHQISVARVLRDEGIGLISVIVPGLINERRLKLLLVDLSGLHSDLN